MALTRDANYLSHYTSCTSGAKVNWRLNKPSKTPREPLYPLVEIEDKLGITPGSLKVLLRNNRQDAPKVVFWTRVSRGGQDGLYRLSDFRKWITLNNLGLNK